MKNFIYGTAVVLSFCLLISSFEGIADDVNLKQHYYCHINTQDGDDIAAFYWSSTNALENQAALLTQKVSTLKSNRYSSNKRMAIKRVYECVVEGMSFKNKEINILAEDITQ